MVLPVRGLVVLYIGSYADLTATFAAFGYDGHISWLMPLGIDLPVTASVLAQMLPAAGTASGGCASASAC